MTSCRDGQIAGRYVSGRSGNIYLLDVEVDGPERGGVVIVPPFAEEMNRSRKMLSAQARMLARIGYRVIVPDLYGTGDSYGEFSEASWTAWKDDVRLAITMAGGGDGTTVSLLGMRLGSLLLADTLGDSDTQAMCTVMWSPQLNGGQALDQFLRLRTMATMLNQAMPKESIADLYDRLRSKGEIEVAGYTLSEKLVSEIRALNLTELLNERLGTVYWLELTPASTGTLSYAVRKAVDSCTVIPVDVRQVVGPQFWSTAETVVAEQLLAETTQIFDSQNA